MYATKTLKEKIKLLLIILIPILITQVSMYAMNFFDTIMSGRAGASELAGVAIGSSLWVPISTGINGILMAMSPIVAHYIGAQEEKKIQFSVQQGIYLAIGLGAIVSVIGYFLIDPILNLMDLEPQVRHVAKYYLISLGFGIIPMFIYNLLRCYIDGLGQTRTSMVIVLIALPINILLNYIFIFGKLGVPAMGGIGAGIATAITFFINMTLSIIIVYRVEPFRTHRIFNNWKKINFHEWWQQLRIGVPIGFSIFFEVSIFAAVTLLLSAYGTNTLAAHQAANSFASLLYMIPLSIAMSLTIAVGYEVGAKRMSDAKTYAYTGIVSGVFFSLFAGGIIYLLDTQVAGLYSNNPEVIELTKNFLYFAIFFQFADGVAAPIQGVLRGYKDVNITFWMALISYWAIGLPSGYLLANYTTMDAYGYWMGLIIGLTVGAITLFSRMYYLQKRLEKKLT
ncbi:MATE family multidrug resistance protein [Gracilibacillus halotolerans]|uniref:Probable multidrug resistance protein NorM n=1 Tax=Gracilibacillus halotolerans TaxID=74386 RepID=A0A841RM74_9BACI|nr:MATE family efflux transporter [Gracilibacillus halotolerans]MBB6512723.1 MATE family multidrug resistance protein [Gracilibacillus halotolerans]